MSLPRDDLDLIDALVWCGAISRVTAREVAATAEPGRVATCIMGLGSMIGGPVFVIVERLARAERTEEDDRQRGMDRDLSEQPETD